MYMQSQQKEKWVYLMVYTGIIRADIRMSIAVAKNWVKKLIGSQQVPVWKYASHA